jgi:hypothetical protein
MPSQDQSQQGKQREQSSLSSQDPSEGRSDVPQETKKNTSTRHQERKYDLDKTNLEEQNRTSTDEPAEGRPDAD